MKTINIRGKDYITVNERLKEFRNNFKDYSLTTEIIELGQDNCTMKATITDDKGVIRATGFAREVISKSPINKFAFVENCETSAIGRALGNFGIGIDTAICTADELLMKMAQETSEKTPAQKAQETKTQNKLAKEEALKKYESVIEYFRSTPEPTKEALNRADGIRVSLENFGLYDQAKDLSARISSYDSIPY